MASSAKATSGISNTASGSSWRADRATNEWRRTSQRSMRADVHSGASTRRSRCYVSIVRSSVDGRALRLAIRTLSVTHNNVVKCIPMGFRRVLLFGAFISPQLYQSESCKRRSRVDQHTSATLSFIPDSVESICFIGGGIYTNQRKHPDVLSDRSYVETDGR